MDSNKKNNQVIDFDAFLKKNRKKICDVTPKNPAVKKDDEWLAESEWDALFNELKEN